MSEFKVGDVVKFKDGYSKSGCGQCKDCFRETVTIIEICGDQATVKGKYGSEGKIESCKNDFIHLFELFKITNWKERLTK